MSVKSESECDPIHPAVRARPWAAKAKELEEKEGLYDDYGAWEWWIENQVVKYGPDGAGDLLSDMDADNKVGLYATMCKLADGDYTGKEGDR